MADTATLQPTLDPFSSTPRETTGRPAGAMGFFGDLERDIFSAGKDLLEGITGIGGTQAEVNPENNPPQKERLEIGGQTEKVFNDADQINRRRVQEVIEHYATIDQAVQKVAPDRIERLAKDIERISGGEFSMLDLAAEAQPNVTKPDLDSPEVQNIAINTAYLIWNERAEKLELTKNPPTSIATNITAEAQPIGFTMRQGEMDMGKERVGGGHFTTAPG